MEMAHIVVTIITRDYCHTCEVSIYRRAHSHMS